jgi:acyl-CoA thioesterase-1
MVPGVARVRGQVLPFFVDWQEANTVALRERGPLWVALGDSLSQGIGAQSIDGGWIGQLKVRLDSAGRPFRLVNLSVTGARVNDVLQEQLPRMRELGVNPALVTVLIGANDMILPRRRPAAVDQFAHLLALLPADVTVVATMPRRNRHALEINSLIEAAAAHRGIAVADLRGRTLVSLRGTRSDDHFHPNELGYRSIADAFAAALGLAS